MSKFKDSLGSNTRQMLDELDALMEKMLALPVNQTPEAAPMTATSSAEPAPASIQAPPVFSGPRARSAPVAASAQVLVGQLAVLHSQGAARPARPQAREAPPEPAPSSFDENIPPPLARLAQPAVSRAMAPRPSSFSFRPLLWFNQGFDLFTQRLGLAGGWLRSSQGRLVLGLLGLALLGMAAGWLLKDWLGWTWELDSLE